MTNEESVIISVIRVETELEPPYECAEIPKMQKVGDACHDLVSRKVTYLRPSETIAIGTGIKVKIPEGYCMRIYGRSSLCIKGLVVSAGIIDSGYRDEVKVVLTNASKELQIISACARIAQCRIEKLTPTEFIEIDDMGSLEDFLEGDRGGGFGSTDEGQRPLCPNCKFPLTIVQKYSAMKPRVWHCPDCRSVFDIGAEGEVMEEIDKELKS